MVDTVITTPDGVELPFTSLENDFGYDGSDNLITITIEYAGRTYVQTLTYDGVNVSVISAFTLTSHDFINGQYIPKEGA